MKLMNVTFKIVSSEALPKRFRDWGESANDEAALDEEDDGSVCELLLLNLCGSVLDFSHLSLSPSWVFCEIESKKYSSSEKK